MQVLLEIAFDEGAVMRTIEGDRILLSASDLMRFMGCAHATALDLAYQIEIAALLRDLQARTGITIILSTHDLNFAAGLCRSLVLLSQGTVLAAGPTADVLTQAAIRRLYGVDADVRLHQAAGHLVVIPLRRLPPGAHSS